MSREFLDRRGRFQPSSDPDTATAETILLMCGQIDRSANDPQLRALARDAITRYKGGPFYLAGRRDPKSADAIAQSDWWLAKLNLRFVHHEKMIRVLWGESDQLQLLISPDVLIRTWGAEGDCAIYTMLICALLKAQGIGYEVVTVACDRTQPSTFSHVYARAILSDGDRLPLDASHGKNPGWEVPAHDVFRKRVYDSAGREVPDAARSSSLHGYSRRGLGEQVCTPYMGCYDTSVFPTTTAPTPASAPSAGWSTFLQGALNQGINLAGRVFAPTTTYQSGPQGTLITTPGSAPIGGFPLGAGTVGAVPGWVWIVGIGGIAFLFMRRGK